MEAEYMIRIEPYWENIIKKKDNVFIWGAGFLGEQVYYYCRERDINIVGFIDNNRENVGCQFLGVEVYDKDYLRKNSPYVIIAIAKYYNEIIEYLFDNGYTAKDFCYLMEPVYSPDDIVYRGCRVGRYTYGYKDLLKYFPMADAIGRYCSINGSAYIWNNHSLDCVTTSPFLDDFRLMQADKYLEHKFLVKKYGKHHNNHPFENSEIRNNKPVTIGNDVWIGANVCIMPGVSIGDGAVVAAGAVVCHDVEPYSIVGGVPACHIRYRFSKEQIVKFMKIKWWDWPHEVIENNIELLYQPEKFLSKFYKE